MTIQIEMDWAVVGIAAALLASAFGGFAWLWGRLDKKFEKMDASMKEIKTELKADIARVESSLKADIAKSESSLKADIAKLENSLRSDISKAELWVINLFGIVNRPLPIERPAQGE